MKPHGKKKPSGSPRITIDRRNMTPAIQRASRLNPDEAAKRNIKETPHEISDPTTHIMMAHGPAGLEMLEGVKPEHRTEAIRVLTDPRHDLSSAHKTLRGRKLLS